jgi:isoquinoline 1-oxidoreductase subunit alpha
MLELTINGKAVKTEASAEMPILWLLRDVLNMTGTKFGCGVMACGACTVLIDGVATRSCLTPASSAVGKQLRTIESLGLENTHALQKAWIAEQVPQCGYCQSGMLMASVALLEKTPNPRDAGVDAAITNLCRCGTYQRVKAGIKRAAAELSSAPSAAPSPRPSPARGEGENGATREGRSV